MVLPAYMQIESTFKIPFIPPLLFADSSSGLYSLLLPLSNERPFLWNTF